MKINPLKLVGRDVIHFAENPEQRLRITHFAGGMVFFDDDTRAKISDLEESKLFLVLPEIVNLKLKPEPPYLYIGRKNEYLNLEGSKWGNPFVMKNEAQRPQVLKDYKGHVLNSRELWEALDELEGERLACWCHPKPCHANVLIDLLIEKRKRLTIPGSWLW